MKNTKKSSATFAEFKSKVLSIVQKVIVMFIACLMLLGVLPIGLMPDSDTAKYNGEFVRLSPTSEIYSNPGADGSGTAVIGSSGSAYLKFSLDRFADTNTDDIKSIKLRLAFLNGSGAVGGDVAVSIIPDGINPKHGIGLSFPVLNETPAATLYPQTGGTADSLSEIDMTEYAKALLAQNKTEISFRLSGTSSVCPVIASNAYGDPAYRPCLKVVTGEAEDTDSGSLEKVRLTDAVYVSSHMPNASGSRLAAEGAHLLAGGGNETYLKYDIDENAVLGTVYSAVLSLSSALSSPNKIQIYCINNNQWTGDTISYSNRPRGDENTASSAFAATAKASGRTNFDITQTVCEALTRGIKTLTFRITGIDGDTPIHFSGTGNPKTAPQLYIKASDDKNVSCTAEAALNALGSNRASFVTMNLASSYSAADNTDAKIKWTEYNDDGNNITNRHISENGEVARPKWFEGNAQVHAVASIRSGDYTAKREFRLTVPAEAAPNYSKYKFGNYTDIGNSRSEDDQKLECVNTSGSKWRWVDGRIFTYRIPDDNGAMVLNFSCISGSDNFLTLKLWESEETQSRGFMLAPIDGSPILLSPPTKAANHESGFVYATYALPRSFTDGKSYVSLRLSCAKDDTGESEPRGIYAAYMTQSPYFEPSLFSKQGEKLISEPFFGESAIRKFIDNLQAISTPLNFTDETPYSTNDGTNAASAAQQLSVDDATGNIVFAGPDANIAFSIDEDAGSAAVYQRLEYYDRYSSDCPVISENGLVSVDFGDYKMIWNKYGDKAVQIPYERLEMSGEYKEVLSGNYYSFSEDWQMKDDSVIPNGIELQDGKSLAIPQQSAVLLVHAADPMQSSDWRVNMINDRSVSSLAFENGEKVQSVTVKAVGGIPDNAETVNIMFCVYEDGKLISLCEKSADVFRSINIYTVDFSEFDIYMKKGLSFRIFVLDNTEKLTDLAPKLEFPT